jgi:hypothetical protein
MQSFVVAFCRCACSLAAGVHREGCSFDEIAAAGATRDVADKRSRPAKSGLHYLVNRIHDQPPLPR